jgi:hypothetical protein
MSVLEPKQPPKRPEQKPIGDPPRRRGPYPVDGPVDDSGSGADPDYLPGDSQQPEDLPKR